MPEVIPNTTRSSGPAQRLCFTAAPPSRGVTPAAPRRRAAEGTCVPPARTVSPATPPPAAKRTAAIGRNCPARARVLDLASGPGWWGGR